MVYVSLFCVVYLLVLKRFGGGDGIRLCGDLAFGGRPVIGEEVEQGGFPHALPLVIDDDALRAGAVVADLNGPVGEVARGLVAGTVDAEGVVLADGSGLFPEKTETFPFFSCVGQSSRWTQIPSFLGKLP